MEYAKIQAVLSTVATTRTPALLRIEGHHPIPSHPHSSPLVIHELIQLLLGALGCGKTALWRGCLASHQPLFADSCRLSGQTSVPYLSSKKEQHELTVSASSTLILLLILLCAVARLLTRMLLKAQLQHDLVASGQKKPLSYYLQVNKSLLTFPHPFYSLFLLNACFALCL